MQAAEGLAEWLHAEVRRELEIELDQGRRYSWGYPACPDQSEHEKVERLLGLVGDRDRALRRLRARARAVDGGDHRPPPAGGLLRDEVRLHPAEKKGDELIAGTDRGGELPPDEDPEGDGTIEAESDAPAADPTTA